MIFAFVSNFIHIVLQYLSSIDNSKIFKLLFGFSLNHFNDTSIYFKLLIYLKCIVLIDCIERKICRHNVKGTKIVTISKMMT